MATRVSIEDAINPEVNLSDESESEDDQPTVEVTSESRKTQNAQFQTLLVSTTCIDLEAALINWQAEQGGL